MSALTEHKSFFLPFHYLAPSREQLPSSVPVESPPHLDPQDHESEASMYLLNTIIYNVLDITKIVNGMPLFISYLQHIYQMQICMEDRICLCPYKF